LTDEFRIDLDEIASIDRILNHQSHVTMNGSQLPTLDGEFGPLGNLFVSHIQTADIEGKVQDVLYVESEMAVKSHRRRLASAFEELKAGSDPVEVEVEEGSENRVLRGKVMEERRLTNTHRLCDVARGRAEKSSCGEQFRRLRKDSVLCRTRLWHVPRHRSPGRFLDIPTSEV